MATTVATFYLPGSVDPHAWLRATFPGLAETDITSVARQAGDSGGRVVVTLNVALTAGQKATAEQKLTELYTTIDWAET